MRIIQPFLFVIFYDTLSASAAPIQFYDINGLNAAYNILSHTTELSEDCIDKGKLGIASGQGFNTVTCLPTCSNNTKTSPNNP